MRFISRDCHLRVERNDTIFTRRYARETVFRAPMAHGDGNYVADPDVLARLHDEGRVAFRYAMPSGEISPLANCNGSSDSIAGVFSDNLRVLGMMPHPENLIEDLTGGTDGLPLFASLCEAFAA